MEASRQNQQHVCLFLHEGRRCRQWRATPVRADRGELRCLVSGGARRCTTRCFTSSGRPGAPSSNCDVLPYPCPCKYRRPNHAWRDGVAPLVPALRITRERRRGVPSSPALLSCRCAQAGWPHRSGWSPAGCCGCRWCRRSCRPSWPWKPAALGSPLGWTGATGAIP